MVFRSVVLSRLVFVLLVNYALDLLQHFKTRYGKTVTRNGFVEERLHHISLDFFNFLQIICLDFSFIGFVRPKMIIMPHRKPNGLPAAAWLSLEVGFWRSRLPDAWLGPFPFLSLP